MPARSSASATAASVPAARSAPALSSERVIPVTRWPARKASGTRRRPTAPVAPAINTRIADAPLKTRDLSLAPTRKAEFGLPNDRTVGSGREWREPAEGALDLDHAISVVPSPVSEQHALRRPRDLRPYGGAQLIATATKRELHVP